jgi:hypothetical protein
MEMTILVTTPLANVFLAPFALFCNTTTGSPSASIQIKDIGFRETLSKFF